MSNAHMDMAARVIELEAAHSITLTDADNARLQARVIELEAAQEWRPISEMVRFMVDAAQAEEMVRFMVDGLPALPVGDR